MLLQQGRLHMSKLKRKASKAIWSPVERKAWRISTDPFKRKMVKQHLYQNIIIGIRTGIVLFEKKFSSDLGKIICEFNGKSQKQTENILNRRIKIISTLLLNKDELKIHIKKL